MGADIHPAVEVRRKGIWRYHRPAEPCRWYAEVWSEDAARDYNARMAKDYPGKYPPVKAGDRKNRWDRCKTRLPDFFDNRNYLKFAILGDVRNAWDVKPISDDRGVPYDISDAARAKLSDEHSPGWVTLRELSDYDYTAEVTQEGVISEAAYLRCLITKTEPESWSGMISGGNIVTLSPEKYLALFGESNLWGTVKPGTRTYDPTKSYFISHSWSRTLRDNVGDIADMIVYMTPLIPKGGTPDDVRVVFDFDS